MRDGLNGYGGGGLRLFAVHMNGMLAEACLKAGQPESAALALDAAAVIEDSGGLYWSAENRRLRGEIALHESVNDPTQAEGYFRDALADRPRSKSEATGASHGNEPREAVARRGSSPRGRGAASRPAPVVHRRIRHSRLERGCHRSRKCPVVSLQFGRDWSTPRLATQASGRSRGRTAILGKALRTALSKVSNGHPARTASSTNSVS